MVLNDPGVPLAVHDADPAGPAGLPQDVGHTSPEEPSLDEFDQKEIERILADIEADGATVGDEEAVVEQAGITGDALYMTFPAALPIGTLAPRMAEHEPGTPAPAELVLVDVIAPSTSRQAPCALDAMEPTSSGSAALASLDDTALIPGSQDSELINPLGADPGEMTGEPSTAFSEGPMRETATPDVAFAAQKSTLAMNRAPGQGGPAAVVDGETVPAAAAPQASVAYIAGKPDSSAQAVIGPRKDPGGARASEGGQGVAVDLKPEFVRLLEQAETHKSAEAPQTEPATRQVTHFRSAMVANVAEQLQAARPEDGSITLRLKPHGMGMIEVEVAKNAQGMSEIILRVQNPMVLDALRAESQAMSDILGGQGGLSFDLYQSGQERGQSEQKRSAAGATSGGSADSDSHDEAEVRSAGPGLLI
ncbi:hypothetical protein ACEUZ9_004057 [Paracoccus litorisediminis]|uniref:hypothetical protein n=1 Tax=Paracoccus litorisediminis TaxID=2006130 RepID=UPI0037304A7A